jgi:IS1 family transposase
MQGIWHGRRRWQDRFIGDPETVPDAVGAHTAYVERTNLTSRQMNGRLVRKTLSYSKQVDALTASCAWEDWVVGLHASTQDARDSGA